ncbi:MAG: hypothetical protein AAGN46_14330 [Acidobacteriota bacterium]
MTMPIELPDLDRLPSVLETSEVDQVLREILAALDLNAEISPSAAVERMADALSARGDRPDDRLDVEVSERLLRWIRAHWPTGDVDFAEQAMTVLCCLSCDGVGETLNQFLARDTRPEIRADLRQCLSELGLEDTTVRDRISAHTTRQAPRDQAGDRNRRPFEEEET